MNFGIKQGVFKSITSIRFFGTTNTSFNKISRVKLGKDIDKSGIVEVEFFDGKLGKFHNEWLIDHDPEYIHPESLQRQIDSSSLHIDISKYSSILSANIKDSGSTLVINVDSKMGSYSNTIHHNADFLYKNNYSKQTSIIEKLSVDKNLAKERLSRLNSWGTSDVYISKISFEEVEPKKMIKLFEKQGFFVISDMPQNKTELLKSIPSAALPDEYYDTCYNNKPTENLNQKSIEQALVTEYVFREIFGAPRETFYGRIWDTAPKDDDKVINDTAYTKDALYVHNDCCYLKDMVGVQAFNCVAQSEESEDKESLEGYTRICDGFKVMEILLNESPETFEFMTQNKLKWMSKEKGVVMEALEYSFRFNVTGEDNSSDVCFRYNTYDQSIINFLPFEKVNDFYRHNRIVSEVMRREGVIARLKLNVGDMLVINNKRVCHGREAFLGYRSMVGCYGGSDEWLSKFKVAEQT